MAINLMKLVTDLNEKRIYTSLDNVFGCYNREKRKLGDKSQSEVKFR